MSCGQPYSHDERIDISFKIMHSSSLVLIWSFADPIHPQVHVYVHVHVIVFRHVAIEHKRFYLLLLVNYMYMYTYMYNDL